MTFKKYFKLSVYEQWEIYQEFLRYWDANDKYHSRSKTWYRWLTENKEVQL